MVGTIIDPVKMCPLFLQEILHLLVNLMNQGFGEITPCHTRLIRDHHRLPFMFVQQSNRLTYAGKKIKPFDMVYVSHLFIEGPVPIKKDGSMCHTSLDFGMPIVECGIRIRNPNLGRSVRLGPIQNKS
jgi:hypothetical protein